MRGNVIFILGFHFIFTTAVSADDAKTIRYVFKGDQKQLSNKYSQTLNKFNFGLSTNQTEQIFQLTSGKVDFSNIYYVDAPQSQKLLLKDSSIERIYPNVPPPFTFKTIQYAGDPQLLNQWWIQSLKVPAAWKYATGAGITIADCDAGYYHDEPDLAANMLLHYRYDLSNQHSPYVVDDGSNTSHGTAVTAIMAGVLNGKGTSGIAYNAKIVPLQNFNYDRSDSLDKEEATARCVLRAITVPGVQIIVLENQMYTSSSEGFIGTRNAVRLAQRSGIIVVGAAGNSGYELTAEEQDDTGSIIVGAIEKYGRMLSYSNYGARITVSAFGEGLYTLYGRGGAFGMFGGTSGATPQVAATVALMKEVNPRLTPTQARQILQNTMSTTNSNYEVGGQLNTEAAVLAARAARFQAVEFQEQQEFKAKLINILAQ